EIRAASLLFEPSSDLRPAPPSSSHIAQPLSVLVIVEPAAIALPHPRVADGQLLQAHRTLREADRAALEVALRLREQAAAPVIIPHAGLSPDVAPRKTDSEAALLLRGQAACQSLVRPPPAAAAVDAWLPLRPFTLTWYLAGLARVVDVDRWAKKVEPRRV